VAWSHGTTGTADICAPSKDKTLTGNDSYTLMGTWLKRGYAVVRTDYEGLGTPGPHPYLAGDSAAHSSLDIIRAARQLDRRVGTKFVTSGHSQGGHATIWAAARASKYVPELTLRGTVAFAPASHLSEQGAAIPALTSPNPIGGLVAIILAGINVQHPELDLESSLFSDKFNALYPQIEERCLGELGKSDSFGGLAPAEFFKPGSDLGPGTAAIDDNDPENLRLGKAPLLIEQGDADTTVVPTYSQQLTDELKSRGAKVTYETYAGDNHGTVVTGAAARHATAFLAKRLK
jgi:dienelactone hydrolase